MGPDREGVRLDQKWGGLRQFKLRGTEKVECGVWPARDRLHPDPPWQTAQAGHAAAEQPVAQRCRQTAAISEGQRDTTPEFGHSEPLIR
jgi:hypothetical protein